MSEVKMAGAKRGAGEWMTGTIILYRPMSLQTVQRPVRGLQGSGADGTMAKQ
jgi:hypothetical protein